QGRDEGRERRQITPHVRRAGYANGQQLAVAVESGFRPGPGVAAMLVGEKRLGPVRRPADRSAAELRRDQDQRLFGIGAGFHAEAAADILVDDAQLGDVDAENPLGDAIAQAARALVDGIERVAVAGFVIKADGVARFHRVDDDTILHHLDLYNVRGLREGLVAERFLAVDPVETFV